ncbi:MAG: NAD(+)/NADH kinase [Candidatus Baldrarchaeota archaeon]
MIKKVAITSRLDKNEAIKLIENIVNYLQSKDIKVILDKELFNKVKCNVNFQPLEEVHADLIITIGGDGTVLMTAGRLKRKCPIFSINMGTLGFLTEVEPHESINALEKVLNGDFEIERCERLSPIINGEKLPDALNEILVTSKQPAKLLHFLIEIDGETLVTEKADGLLVATPTGSTAYALSAGGAIIDPRVKAFIITPICPLGFTLKSLVVPLESTVTIKLLKPSTEALLVIDGQFRYSLPARAVIKITKSNVPVLFIRIKPVDIYRRIRKRLLYRGEDIE